MADVKLIALDLDGTLFDDHGVVTSESVKAINYAISKGVTVVISTGRPYSGVPFDSIKDTAINYAITTNGSAVYRMEDGACIFEAPMPDELSLPLVEYLMDKDVHIAAFIQGEGISPAICEEMVPSLIVPQSVKYTYALTRIHVPDLISYVKDNGVHIQKVTLNFRRQPDGSLKNRALVEAHLQTNPALEVVCGGFQNLEFTQKGVDKGLGLRALADHLGIDISQTMAVGDTENDIPSLKAAGIAVAMGNATPEVLAAADYVTASNADEGVAKAIYHFVK